MTVLQPKETQINKGGEIMCYFDSNFHPRLHRNNKAKKQYDCSKWMKMVQKKLHPKLLMNNILDIPSYTAYQPDQKTKLTNDYIQSLDTEIIDPSPAFIYITKFKESDVFYSKSQQKWLFDFKNDKWTKEHYNSLHHICEMSYALYVAFKQQQQLEMYQYFYYGYACIQNPQQAKVCYLLIYI